jgi:hypothetical protein
MLTVAVSLQKELAFVSVQMLVGTSVNGVELKQVLVKTKEKRTLTKLGVYIMR